MTCSIWPGSALTAPRSGPGTMTRSMSSPISRVSIFRFSVTTLLRSSTFGASICLRLNASKLAGQGGGAPGGIGDLLGGSAKRRVRAEAIKQELGVTGDHHQQVVEVMSDASGKPTHGFHLLGLAELLLQSPVFGDVLGKQLEEDGVAFVAKGTSGEAHVDGSVVLGAQSAGNPLNFSSARRKSAKPNHC